MDKIVYRVKDNITFEDFKKNGYKELTADMAGVPLLLDNVAYKRICQSKKSKPVQMIIGIYNNPDWQKGNNLKTINGIDFEEIYNENGEKKLQVVENENLFKVLKEWRLEVNFSDEDRWLCFTISDTTFPLSFCSKFVLDEHCKREIERLKKLDFIEELKVE